MKILLVVSIVFLLTNTPSHIIRIYLFVMSQLHDNYQPSVPIFITQNMLQYLFYANFAANFLLYNASGRTFRRAMVRCGRHCVRKLTTRACIDGQAAVNRRRSFADQPQPVSPPPAAAAALLTPAVGGSDTARNRANVPLIRLVPVPNEDG